MADETKNKIMQATLKLVIDRGYTLTTTKDIAKCAGVSEVTIFRKFESKQNIIKCILEKMQEIPELNMNILDKCTWSLYDDLKMFSTLYFKYVTPDYVKLIIGTRSPEVFPLIKQYIMEIPSTFKKIIMKYFEIMYDKGKISNNNFESITAMYSSINIGFAFIKTSFEDDIISIEEDEYIEQSIKMFAKAL